MDQETYNALIKELKAASGANYDDLYGIALDELAVNPLLDPAWVGLMVEDRWQFCRGLSGSLHVEWLAGFSGIRNKTEMIRRRDPWRHIDDVE